VCSASPKINYLTTNKTTTMKKQPFELLLRIFFAIILSIVLAIVTIIAIHTHDHGRCYQNPDYRTEQHNYLNF